MSRCSGGVDEEHPTRVQVDHGSNPGAAQFQLDKKIHVLMELQKEAWGAA